MARRSTGQVVERKTKRGAVYALRFYAGGERQYVTLGTAEEGWNRRRAEDELAAMMAAVRSGSWRPPEPVAAPRPEPTFHQRASEWYAAGEPGWVDRYREARLSAGQINKTITRLGQILDLAHERELIDRNPVRVNPRRRKVKAQKPRPVYLDSADQIAAVLDAASTLDAKANARTGGRRAFMATLIFAGLRIGEACALRRHHVNLPAERIEVPGTKGRRLGSGGRSTPVLRDELGTYLASRGEVGPYEPMFPTARGTQRDRNNARQRVVDPVVEEAEKLALKRTGRPLPEGLTAHKLRHTFASLLLAHDPDPANAMAQLGHTDPAFTIRVYTHLMRRSPKEREALGALIEGTWEPEKASTGTSAAQTAPDLAPAGRGLEPQTAP
jgi:integrase